MTLLAVVDDPAAASRALAGATAEPVTTVTSGGIGCVGTAGAGSIGPPDREALTRQDGLIRVMTGVCAVLPFRYGTVAGDTTLLEAWLEEQGPALRRSLDSVRGRAEMAVRARSPEADPDPTGVQTGRQYLEGLARSRTADGRLRGLHAALSAAAAGSNLAELDSRRLVGAYLVEAGSYPAFRDLVATEAQRTGVTATVTGPWAPYSFSGDGMDGPGRPAGDEDGRR